MKTRNETLIINYWISVGLVGCKREDSFEIDREEWEDMNQDERFEMVNEHLQNHIEIGWTENPKK